VEKKNGAWNAQHNEVDDISNAYYGQLLVCSLGISVNIYKIINLANEMVLSIFIISLLVIAVAGLQQQFQTVN